MRIFLIDEQTIFRKGLSKLIESRGGYKVVGEASSPAEAQARLSKGQTDVIVMEVDHTGADGVAHLRELKERFPQIPVLILSMNREHFVVVEALGAGADGYLVKTAEEVDLFAALRSVANGGSFIHPEVAGFILGRLRMTNQPTTGTNLADRDRELLSLLAQGHDNKEIAERLFVSVSTVKNTLRSLFRRFGVNDRTSLVVEAINLGVLRSGERSSKA